MPGSGTLSYQELYSMVSKALYTTHVEGKLKSEIIQVRGWRDDRSHGCPFC